VKCTTVNTCLYEPTTVINFMYTTYFGFKEKPFTLTPNPRFIFLSKNHKEAFAHLLYGINNHYGFIELTGEVGTGKTTVLRTLLGQLQEDIYRTALIFSPCLTGVELLRSINSEFGLESDSEYANELLAVLNRFLLAETAAGRTVVLVIDESQNLQPDVLEQIRLISNLETENDKLIQIILAGQPELESLLARPDLRQLNQRIAVRYRLRSMSKAETRLYIRQRMEVAGETGGVSFSKCAIALIYLSTSGVPRMINILCDRTLLIAYGDERRRISAGIVLRGMWELCNRPQSLRMPLVSGSITLIILVGLIVFAMLRLQHLNLFATRSQPAVPVMVKYSSPVINSTYPAALHSTETLEQEIRSYDQNDTHVLAFNAMAELWDVRQVKAISGDLHVPDMFRRLAARRNMRVTLFKGLLDDAIRLDTPFLFSTRIQGTLGPYCYMVTAAQNGSLSISPALFDSHVISKSELERVASGNYYIVWRNTGQIPDTFSKNEIRSEVKSLQLLLRQAGFYKGDLGSEYNTETSDSVRNFQNAAGIAVNENLGEMTLAILSRYDSSHRIPSLKEGVRE